MHGDDDGKGFKGLGKLAGSQPPPVPAPPARPVAALPVSPRPVQPPGDGGTPKSGSSGCAKVALVLVVMLVLAVAVIVGLGRLLAPDEDASSDAAGYVDPAADPQAFAEAQAAAEAEQARLAAELARIEACRTDMGAHPNSGEVLARVLDGGGHTLKVNGGGEDGLVKLRQDGRTVLSFYVRAGESAGVDDIPDGTYQVLFAHGSEFSRGCGEFLVDMSVSADPDPLVLAVTQEGDASYFAIMEYTLTRQAGGNFEPDVLDAEAFRD